MKVEVTVEIAAQPETVRGTVIDVARWPEFIRGIEKVEMLDAGPLRVGARFRETRTMLGRSATEEMQVAELAPRFVVTAQSHGTRYTATHVVEPAATGSRLRLTFEGIPVTLAARLLGVIGALFVGALRRQLEADLADLKVEAERRAGGSPAA